MIIVIIIIHIEIVLPNIYTFNFRTIYELVFNSIHDALSVVTLHNHVHSLEFKLGTAKRHVLTTYLLRHFLKNKSPEKSPNLYY